MGVTRPGVDPTLTDHEQRILDIERMLATITDPDPDPEPTTFVLSYAIFRALTFSANVGDDTLGVYNVTSWDKIAGTEDFDVDGVFAQRVVTEPGAYHLFANVMGYNAVADRVGSPNINTYHKTGATWYADSGGILLAPFFSHDIHLGFPDSKSSLTYQGPHNQGGIVDVGEGGTVDFLGFQVLFTLAPSGDTPLTSVSCSFTLVKLGEFGA